MPARPLTLHEREEIRAGTDRHEADGAIAQRLGRHRCTIKAEITRNGDRGAYSAVEAQRRADEQRHRPKTPILVADPTLCAHVTARLEAKDSPMTISAELAFGVHGLTGAISHESISGGSTPTAPEACQRASTSACTAARTEVGHLEGDLITGAYTRSAIVTVFDRTSRHLWLAEFPDGHGAEATLVALCEILTRIPEHLRRTLTWDQGREMARHQELAELCGIDVYVCDPHSHRLTGQ